MRHLDLFSGIGGFSLAADWVWGKEHEIVSFVEIDPFCQAVLKKHWPDVPIHSDIKDFDGKGHEGTINLITGGFPCQPTSIAGRRLGQSDSRWLWPDMLRVINAVRPRWIIAENVDNLKNMGLDEVLDDLEASSYETTQLVIPACAVGLPHRRNRIWIVANAESELCRKQYGKEIETDVLSDTEPARLEGHVGQVLARADAWGQNPNIARSGQRDPAPRICGKSDGIPQRVDRLKSLGNAIVPQVAAVIMQAIKDIDARAE